MILKKIALCSVTAVLCAAGQGVYAHTGIKDKVFVEGVGNTGPGSATAYNAFTITHGCASNAFPEGTPVPHADIIAMAALFPNSIKANQAIVYRYKTGTVVKGVPGVDGTELTGVPTSLAVAHPGDLSSDINGATQGAAFSNMGLGLVSPNLFGDLIIPKLDGLSNLRGYGVFNGPVVAGAYTYISAPLSESIISTTGLSAFKFTVPTFQSTSCAANLIVRVAVSNWCKRGAASATLPDRKDVWIGTDTGSILYSMTGPNNELMPNSRTTLGMPEGGPYTEQGNGKSFWPAFTVTRNLTTNPLPGKCNGESYDVVIEPDGLDIDNNLSIKAGNYPAAAPGPKFY